MHGIVVYTSSNTTDKWKEMAVSILRRFQIGNICEDTIEIEVWNQNLMSYNCSFLLAAEDKALLEAIHNLRPRVLSEVKIICGLYWTSIAYHARRPKRSKLAGRPTVLIFCHPGSIANFAELETSILRILKQAPVVLALEILPGALSLSQLAPVALRSTRIYPSSQAIVTASISLMKTLPKARAARSPIGRIFAGSGKRKNDESRRLDWLLVESAVTFRPNKPSPLSAFINAIKFPNSEELLYKLSNDSVTRKFGTLKLSSWVAKNGRSTGITLGWVFTVGREVQWADGMVICEAEIKGVYRDFADYGDSGSFVHDEDGDLVGILLGQDLYNNDFNSGFVSCIQDIHLHPHGLKFFLKANPVLIAKNYLGLLFKTIQIPLGASWHPDWLKALPRAMGSPPCPPNHQAQRHSPHASTNTSQQLMKREPPTLTAISAT
ncbi:MAG: hypothetical protein MMC33_007459 [Icmadophila ericetorum]|nr:hypothetical protein [Icmadophila ericetorum]